MRRARTLLKLIGLTALVGLVLSRLDLDNVRQNYQGLGAATLAQLWAIYSISMAVRALRWGWQVRCLGLRFEPLRLTVDFMIGILLGQVTPLRVGELYRLRALEIPPERRLEVGTLAAAAVVWEKATEVAVLTGFAAVGALFVEAAPAITAGLWGVFLASLAWVMLPIGLPAALRHPALERILRVTLDPLIEARDRVPFSVRLWLLSLAAGGHLLNTLGGLIIYRAFGPMPLWDFTFRLPLLVLLQALPITVGGIGLREAGAMAFFGAIGYPASSAAVAATLGYLCLNLLPLLTLLPLTLLRRLSRPE